VNTKNHSKYDNSYDNLALVFAFRAMMLKGVTHEEHLARKNIAQETAKCYQGLTCAFRALGPGLTYGNDENVAN